MNKDILKTGPQEFIKNNWNTDTLSLLLKKPLFQGISQKELVEQLEAKKKSQYKLPTWFGISKIYYPNKLNIEQTSSEKTAAYKTTLVSGKSLLDMTGGFGVDSFYFSKKMDTVTHLEVDENLSQIAAHNFKILGVKNCNFVAENGLEFLQKNKHKFDWIYIDPSRRNKVKKKVFQLSDCLPNIPENLNLVFEHTEAILLKASPLLDLTLGNSELKHVTSIHVVAIRNEVKELLFTLKRNSTSPIKITTINLKKDDDEHFEFLWDNEREVNAKYSYVKKYLYEPNVAILKAGGFASVGNAFGATKIATHSHLYTAEQLIDFPGRRFLVTQVLPYNKKAMKSFSGTKANITTRNFSETVAQIRKRYRIKDGGDQYLFFTQDLEKNQIAISCQRA